MKNVKKSKAERAKTRHEQNKRAAARKASIGLQRISLWIPKAAIEVAEERGLTRIGIIFAEPEAKQSPEVLVKKADGHVEALPYNRSLFES